MPTSVPNFNFLAPIVTEIWRSQKIQNGGFWSPQMRFRGQFIICSHSTCKWYQRTKFQLSRSIIFGDMRVVPK